MVDINVILQSVIQLARFSQEVADVLERAQSGEEISDAEWAGLRTRLDDANEEWESAQT